MKYASCIHNLLLLFFFLLVNAQERNRTDEITESNSTDSTIEETQQVQQTMTTYLPSLIIETTIPPTENEFNTNNESNTELTVAPTLPSILSSNSTSSPSLSPTPPPSSVSANCSFYLQLEGRNCSSSVWNELGKLQPHSICYDAAQCYSFAVYSIFSTCYYNLVYEDQKTQGQLKSNEEIILYQGKDCYLPCTDVELYIDPRGSNAQYIYNPHIPDETEQGSLDENESFVKCLDMTQCHIMEILKYKSTPYYFLQQTDSQMTIQSGPMGIFTLMGSCSDGVIISTGFGDGVFEYILNNVTGSLPEGEIVFLEMDLDNECYTLQATTNNTATYYIMKDSIVHEIGTSNQYRTFGNSCISICDSNPILSETTQGLELVLLLSTISGMSVFTADDTPQYHAACWLLHEDLSDTTKTLQRYVITLIYFNFHGKIWNYQSGFLTGKHECDWFGVECNTQQQVTSLKLRNNALQGVFLQEIYSLTELAILDLSKNDIGGNLPHGIARLSVLTTLNLNMNQMTGSLPDDIFYLHHLQQIDVSSNILTGFPQNFNNVQNLTSFKADFNNITGVIPLDFIQNAISLQLLDLANNLLTGSIPNDVVKLVNLQDLSLTANELTGTIPLTLFGSSVLRSVRLGFNNINGTVPNVVAQNSQMQLLTLRNNGLWGTLPPQYSQMINLQVLNLESNLFQSSLPLEYASLTNLRILHLEDNFITGTIPFTNCEQFTYINADCGMPPEVECECCNCYAFTPSSSVSSSSSSSSSTAKSCPSSELKLQFSNDINDFISFTIESNVSTIVYTVGELTVEENMLFNICISSTSCFQLTSSSSGTVLNVTVDDVIIYENLNGVTSVTFGYSSTTHQIEANTCDNYQICNTTIETNTEKRTMFNFFVGVSGISAFTDNHNGYHYNALCWWIQDFEEMSSSMTMLNSAQRYLLSLLYFATVGNEWYDNTSWLTAAVSECQWYGVSCKMQNGFGSVNGIRLASNNLDGIIPTELGTLQGLEYLVLADNSLRGPLSAELMNLSNLFTLNVANNRIIGTVPVQIGIIRYLSELDLENNRFSSTIPLEICNLVNLRALKMGSNSFSGEIPADIYNLTLLEVFSVSNNLLKGKASHIENLTNLVHLDLSLNALSGQIPLFGHSHRKLRFAYLNNNAFTGTIHTNIGKFLSLEELYFYSNSIVGSIPNQISNLINMTQLAFSYNEIEGTITSDIGKLQKLSLLQFHSNQITGIADHFNYTISSFITDCGSTETDQALVKCESCTECCNGGGCLEQAITWPRETMQTMSDSTGLNAPQVLFLSSLIGTLVLVVLSGFIYCLRSKLPSPRSSIIADFQNESVYSFFLSRSIPGYIIGFIGLGLQVFLVLLFANAADFQSESNLWAYSYSCPNSSLVCENNDQSTALGWVMCLLLLFVYLFDDIVDGLRLFYECSLILEIKGIFAAMVLIYITVMVSLVSVVFIDATSLSDTALVMNAAVILFLNDLDGQVFSICSKMAPLWMNDIEEQINEHVTKVQRAEDEAEDTIKAEPKSFQDEGSFNNKDNPQKQSMDSVTESDFLLDPANEDDDIENGLDKTDRTKDETEVVTGEPLMNKEMIERLEKLEKMQEIEKSYLLDKINTLQAEQTKVKNDFSLRTKFNREKFDELSKTCESLTEENKLLKDQIEELTQSLDPFPNSQIG